MFKRILDNVTLKNTSTKEKIFWIGFWVICMVIGFIIGKI